MQPSAPSQPPTHPQDFDFIVNPAKPQRSNLIKGDQSMRARILLVGGFALALIVLFTIVSKIFFHGSPAVPALTSVLQEQQELIHLTAQTANLPGVSSANASFAVTTQLSIASAQKELKAYFITNHYKVDAKVLNLRVSKAVDTQLATAAESSTYNSAFKEVMQSQLTTYQRLLKAAYAKTSGAKAHELLSKDYDASNLLLRQLNKS